MTGIAVALAPSPEPHLASRSAVGVGPTPPPVDANAQVAARASTAGYDTWIHQVEPVGDCTRPVRLARTTLAVDRGSGEVLDVRRDPHGLPDGVVHKRCGTRLAAVCPSCRRSTDTTPTTSSMQASRAAKASPTPSPATPPCSSPPPRPRSDRCTPAGSPPTVGSCPAGHGERTASATRTAPRRPDRLSAPRYIVRTGGVIYVESKEEVSKRLGRSTDSGDSVIHAFWVSSLPEPQGADEDGVYAYEDPNPDTLGELRYPDDDPDIW
jgi:hypothetical protein